MSGVYLILKILDYAATKVRSFSTYVIYSRLREVYYWFSCFPDKNLMLF